MRIGQSPCSRKYTQRRSHSGYKAIALNQQTQKCDRTSQPYMIMEMRSRCA
ncbi:MAG: hypothetical protein ACFCUV_15595 [Rivularia sp. (in: cyanobacteria)]